MRREEAGPPLILLSGATMAVDSGARGGWASLRLSAAKMLAQRHDPHHGPGHWKDLLRWIIASETDLPAYTATGLRRIDKPTLWIAGENDPWFAIGKQLEMKSHIRGAEVLIVNNAGHAVQQTHPHLVGPVMSNFLTRHATA